MCNASRAVNRGGSNWFFAWLRERICTGMWWLVPLAFVIVFAGGQQQWFVRAIVAMFALITLRLWDDLADVEYDREQKPTRVLCRMDSLAAAYRLLIVGLLLVSALVMTLGDRGVVFVMVLPMLFVASWLRKRRDVEMRGVWAHVILLKVPALVVGLSRGDFPSGSGLFLYGFVGGYECLHDRELRRSSLTRGLLFIDAILLLLGLGTEILRELKT